MKGVVMRSTGSFYDVLGEDNKHYTCRVRGKIRLDGIKETNPIAVGDHVVFDIEHAVATISEISPRTNHILRQSVKKTGHSHVLAANVDQAMLVATLAFPRTSLGFIDRFLISAESFRIPQMLVFNKKDMLDEAEQKIQNDLVSLYTSIGVMCFPISAIDENQAAVRAALQDKITLVAGHSGVGKSTLINKLAPGIEQRIGEISGFSAKGTHTTTFAEMFPLDKMSFIIDTPGVKEWGINDMTQQEISDYLPEMRDLRLHCKFGSRCLHLNEPKCAVIEAVENGVIATSRYESYVSIVLGKDNRK